VIEDDYFGIRQLNDFEIECLNVSTCVWPIKFIIKQIMLIYFQFIRILKKGWKKTEGHIRYLKIYHRSFYYL